MSHLWTFWSNKQINQCQLELRSKWTTSWESDTPSALNSRQCNYTANPSRVLSVWEDERVHMKGSQSLLSIALSGALLSWDFHWAWERRAAVDALCFTSFMFWLSPSQTHRFGVPFNISTLMFKELFCSPLQFILIFGDLSACWVEQMNYTEVSLHSRFLSS